MDWTFVDDVVSVLPLPFFVFLSAFSASSSSMVFTITEEIADAFCL